MIRITSFLLLITCQVIFGQNQFIRFNQAGYICKAPKNLIINSSEDLKNNNWEILKQGQLIKKGLLSNSIAAKGKHTNFPFNYSVVFSELQETGEYTFKFNQHEIQFSIDKNPYQKFLPEVLHYLRQQRSGTKTTVDKPAGHFMDSLAPIYIQKEGVFEWEPSKTNQTTNAIGGWYDAGDYLKFTLTNAYTTYLLLRAYEANPKALNFKKYSTSNLNDLLDEAKWGLDYLERCYISNKLFIIQIGDERDHQLGNRFASNDQNPHRYAYTSLSRPQLAYSSAAFALAAKTWKSIDTNQAKKYEQKAIALFELAEQHLKCFWYQKGHEIFYSDKSGNDNMQLAAVELFQLTNQKKYKYALQQYGAEAGQGYWSSWADFNMPTHARSAQYYSQSKNYLANDLEAFAKIAKEENNIWNTPHQYTWGTLYSQFGVAYSSLLYQDLTGSSEFSKMTYDVIDYTFGKNNWGYSFIASNKLPNAVQNIYSQTYILQPQLYPTGAIAEGPGDKASHLDMVQWYNMTPESEQMEKFNTSDVIFYDDQTNFQTMETTIAGLADGIFLISLLSR